MAIKKTIYRAIRARLIAAVPEIKSIGRYNSQLQRLGENNPFTLPAAFIEFAAITWNQQAAGIQQGEATIRIHVLQETYKTNISGYSVEYDDDDAAFDLVDKVHAFLNGTDGTTFGPLIRTTEQPGDDFDNIEDWTVEYTFGISDDGSFDATRIPLIETTIETLTIDPAAIVDNVE